MATSLHDAFMESLRLHRELVQRPHRLSFVWSKLEEERRFFGKEPFYQGDETRQGRARQGRARQGKTRKRRGERRSE